MGLFSVDNSLLVGIITIVALALGYIQFRLYPGKRLPLPPGPRKLPVIGNVLDIPTESASKEFADMSKKYNSDIIHLKALGTDIIVLNSYEAVNELLDKRSAIYSSRPKSVMMSELGGYDYIFVGMPYNDRWRTHRRLFANYFHPQNTDINQPREIEYVNVLLGKFLDDPKHFMSHIRHMVGSITLSEVYGFRIKSRDDPYISMVETALKTLEEMATPGAFLVETFPILKYVPDWVPFTRHHQVAAKARRESEQLLKVTYNAMIDAIDDGTILPSFMSKGLADMQNADNINHSEYVETLKQIGVMTFLGGMDTANAALGFFMLAMVLYPEVQKSAQHELDIVLGGRLPSHSDIPSIPYMTALVMELLRWETPVATGFVHCNTEDDIFNGYHIPKDSIIIANQWAMLRDERVYSDPNDFKPERFLKDGKIDNSVRNPEDIAFGFGRRKCPGGHLALSAMWLAMASILSVFDIEKTVDEDGNIVEPNINIGGFTVNHVDPFECSIKPRSRKAVILINSVLET